MSEVTNLYRQAERLDANGRHKQANILRRRARAVQDQERIELRARVKKLVQEKKIDYDSRFDIPIKNALGETIG